MPLYDYECEACSHKMLDVKQSFNETPLSFCPECNQPKLYRVITGGIHVSVKNTNTIGQLADKNAKEYKSRINESQAKKNEQSSKSDKPAYHGEASNREITQMNSKQKQKYIMEGKK